MHPPPLAECCPQSHLLPAVPPFLLLLRRRRPRLAQVEAALAASNFDRARAQLAADVEALSATAAKLMASERLRRILEILLLLGNTMNAGGREEISNAKGFSVDSLLKLCETKTTMSKRKGYTLLEFFVAMVVERGEFDLLLFPREVGKGF